MIYDIMSLVGKEFPVISIVYEVTAYLDVLVNETFTENRYLMNAIGVKYH